LLQHIPISLSARQDIQGCDCQVYRRFPELKQQLYRGHLWNPSYYVGTVGDVTKDYKKVCGDAEGEAWGEA